MSYVVTFTKYYMYEVDARTAEEAKDRAYEHFVSEMRRPIASTSYDEVEVDPDEDEAKEDEIDD